MSFMAFKLFDDFEFVKLPHECYEQKYSSIKFLKYLQFDFFDIVFFKLKLFTILR